MKKLLGFDTITFANCTECGAIFSLDPANDVDLLNINNKDKAFLECPNCESLVNKVISFSSLDETFTEYDLK